MAHLAEQVGRPEDGSSREKAEAPAEVAAGAASVDAAADAESHKKAPAEVAGAVSVEVSADGISERGRWCRSRKVVPHQWRRLLMHLAEK